MEGSVYDAHLFDLPGYDGVEVGIALFDATYHPLRTDGDIDGLVGELTVGGDTPVPGYARTTTTGSWNAATKRLSPDYSDLGVFDVDGAPAISTIVYYDLGDQLPISRITLDAPEAGFNDWSLNPSEGIAGADNPTTVTAPYSDPLARFDLDWYTIAEGTRAPFLVDRAGGSHATTTASVAKVTDPADPFYDGAVLRGGCDLDGGVVDWFTSGYTFTARVGLLPVAQIGGNEWSELFNVSDEDGDYIEVAWYLWPDGTVSIADDHDHGSIDDVNRRWISPPIDGLDWRTGVPLCDIEGVATGLNTTSHHYVVTIDGVEVVNETVTGKVAYPTPPAEAVVTVGSMSGLPAIIDTLTLADQASVALYSFDCHDLTGWTLTEGAVLAIPAEPARPTNSSGFAVDDVDLLDLAAGESFTMFVRALSGPTFQAFGRHITAAFGEGGVGWGVGGFELFGAPQVGTVTDGTDTVMLDDLGLYPVGLQTAALTVDHTDDTATVYVNGNPVATGDASAIGALESTDPLTISGVGTGFVTAAGYARRALDASTHAAIHAALTA